MGFYARLPRSPAAFTLAAARVTAVFMDSGHSCQRDVASRFYKLLYGWRSAASGDGGSASGLTASLRGHRGLRSALSVTAGALMVLAVARAWGAGPGTVVMRKCLGAS